MTEISVNIIGVSEIVAKFKESSVKTRSNIANAVSISLMQLVRDVKEVNLNGKYLKVNKGGLRTSVFSKESFTTNQIKGTVGTNAYYGRIHHFGYKGTYTVKEHLRQMKTKTATVRSHSRTVNLRARPYLTDALEAQRQQITERILRAVEF